MTNLYTELKAKKLSSEQFVFIPIAFKLYKINITLDSEKRKKLKINKSQHYLFLS